MPGGGFAGHRCRATGAAAKAVQADLRCGGCRVARAREAEYLGIGVSGASCTGTTSRFGWRKDLDEAVALLKRCYEVKVRRDHGGDDPEMSEIVIVNRSCCGGATR